MLLDFAAKIQQEFERKNSLVEKNVKYIQFVRNLSVLMRKNYFNRYFYFKLGS